MHGDAHAGNLLRDRSGEVVLCDFDPTCRGPWQVDLVAVAGGERRFGRAGARKHLASAYGYDVTTDPEWPLLREVVLKYLLVYAGVRKQLSSKGGPV